MSETLHISKVNDVYLRVACDDRGIAYELSDFFTFTVPNSHFMQRRNPLWDGKIRLFDMRNGHIYCGLLDHIKKFAEQREYAIEFDEGLSEECTRFSDKLIGEFFEVLKPTSQGKLVEARDYQQAAFKHALEHKRCVLISPTASGKSLIIYSLLRMLRTAAGVKGRKALVIVPKTSLVEQMYSDFADYSTENGYDVDANVHRIYSGKEQQTSKYITISTWQSVYKKPASWFRQYGLVIGDEAHLFQAKSLCKIMEKLVDCPYRIGLTGTLSETKTHKLVLEGLFGPAHKFISTRELMDRKQVADLSIHCILLTHNKEHCKALRRARYHDEIAFLENHTKRNKFIRNLALSLKGNTLVLFNHIEHGKKLFDLIKEKAAVGRKVFLVYGDTDVEVREHVRAIAEHENDAIMVCSFGTFSTGINIRRLHNAVYASPHKSRIRNLQSLGRTLRKGEGKDRANLYDIGDDLSNGGTRQNHTLKHFIYRVETYASEQFSYRMHEVKI